MNVALRTDASMNIGTGHVMRCLTLADALSELGAVCVFVCRPHQGHLMALILQRGHKVLALPELQGIMQLMCHNTLHAHWLGTDWATDAQDTRQALSNYMGGLSVDWLVVDHYALDAHWELALRPQAKHIMIIDDLADRPHACDLLLDQNLGRSEQDYANLLKGRPTTLVGPQYALLRPNFAALRAQTLARRQNKPYLSRLLVTMGGVDKDNITSQVLTALQNCTMPSDLSLTVVMGLHSPWLEQVQALAKQMPWPTEVLVGIDNMAQIMAESDFCIGAAGSTSWERCCLGLPTLMLVLAPNQIAAAKAIMATNSVWMLERTDELSKNMSEFFSKLSINSALKTASAAASSICDGSGTARVTKLLVSLS